MLEAVKHTAVFSSDKVNWIYNSYPAAIEKSKN